MTDQEINDLLARCADGDEQALTTLYDAVAPKLLAIAARMLGDRQQAEDVLQHTMLSAWHSAGDFDPTRARATTWLTSIIRYRALDVLRQRQRQQRAVDTSEQDIADIFGHEQPVATEEPVSDELAKRIDYCFGQISRNEASSIQLAYLDGLTFREVAARLERSIGTVKSWVRRGLEKLKACVER